jgi:RNA polymerase sigma-70 factor (ECF subfamily)
MLRAWRFAGGYDESRGSVRTWLYRIATNACLSYLEGRQRRVLPVDLSGPSHLPDVAKIEERLEVPWLEPFPDALVLTGDPSAVVEARESIRLAFIAALQHLPPRQRAVLILRDVLAMPAAEVAPLLETSVASVNSALQRARAQLAAASPSADGDGLVQPSDEESRDLLDRYTSAFTTMDVEALKGTLREDALLQMPPFGEWFLGRDAIGEFLATGFARGGSFRCTPMRANGQPALGVYRRRNDDAHRFNQVQVLTMTETGIARIDAFLVHGLYVQFGLPAVLEDERG